MAGFDWRTFLEEFNRELVGIDEVREEVGLPGADELSEDLKIDEWLGFDGASESDLESFEERLGVVLPPSYRGFLVASNGWRITGLMGVRLLPTTEVEWLRQVDPDLVKIWTAIGDQWPPIGNEEYFDETSQSYGVRFRPEYIPDMLVVSDRGWFNVQALWLNPRVMFADGEWEAWSFTTDNGHASRYRSFGDLMEDQLKSARVDRRSNGS